MEPANQQTLTDAVICNATLPPGKAQSRLKARDLLATVVPPYVSNSAA